MDAREMLTVDPTIYGWPWMPGEATWVEPTALALLALADIPQGPAAADRVQRALRFLVERRCLDGDWNVGNPTMLGTNLPPRAHPTAWALLALARLAPDVITEEDLMALHREMQLDGGALALAWGTLALRAVGVAHEEPRAQLATMQSLDGSWNGNPYHTAVAAMALHETPGGLFPS